MVGGFHHHSGASVSTLTTLALPLVGHAARGGLLDRGGPGRSVVDPWRERNESPVPESRRVSHQSAPRPVPLDGSYRMGF